MDDGSAQDAEEGKAMILARKGLEISGSRGAGRRLAWVLSLVVLTMGLLGRSALAAQEAVAQELDVRGTVVDEAGRPLVGAFVALDGSEWGSLTDEKGRFRIPDVFAGRVALTVELLGYEKLAWTGTVGPESDPLLLRLAPQPILLEGLTVVTDRFRARRNATATSVRTYEQRHLATAPQQTLVEFVQSRAGLSPVRCPLIAHTSLCFRSRGRAFVPSVWVDEVPVIGGLDYLESFRPHELYMVEVYAQGRHIRAYTHQFMERAAKQRLRPIALTF